MNLREQNGFTPDISGTQYTFVQNTHKNDIGQLLKNAQQKDRYTVKDIDIAKLHNYFTLPDRETPAGEKEADTDALLSVMSEPKYRRGPQKYMDSYQELKQNITSHIHNKKDYMQIGKFTKKEQITILLPAFANKSFNPLKCSRTSPDLGEVWSLLHLDSMCRDLSQVYGAPVKMEIVTDGIVYAPLFNEPVDIVTKYKDTLQEWAKILACDTLHITDMTEILSDFPDFYQQFEQKKETITQNWEQIKNIPATQNLIANTRHNINTSGYEYTALIEVLAYNVQNELANTFNRLTEESAIKYKAFVGTLYEQEVLKKTYPTTIRATCHPKEGQRGIHLVGKESYNYPYNGVAFWTGSKVKIVNEVDMMLDENIIPVYREGEDKPFFYTKKGTNITCITK